MNAIEPIKHVLLHWGASWVLWFLGLLSLVSLTIIVERWLFYRSRDCNLQEMARKLASHLGSRDFDGAIVELGKSRSVAAAIAAAGLQLADRGPAAADKAMQSAAALERGRLERWLAYLGTLGNNAPFVGLFGTVIGVIGAFEELGHGAPAHGVGGNAAAAAQVASQAVMASIAEALVATAVGILVALPAVAAYNYFQRRIAGLLAGTEVLSNLVLAYLSEGPCEPTGGTRVLTPTSSPKAERPSATGIALSSPRAG